MTGQFRPAATTQGNADLLSLWAGQSAAVSTESDAAALLRALVAGIDRQGCQRCRESGQTVTSRDLRQPHDRSRGLGEQTG